MTGQDPATVQTRVLIVEDDEELGNLLKDMLEGIGHRVCLAETLETARQRLAQGEFGLAVVDIRLGDGGSGLELLHELAPRAPDVAVVMMTGETTIQTAVDCLRDGAFDYVVKPFRMGELRSVLARAQQRQRKLLAERDRIEDQLRVLGRFSSENPGPVLRVARSGLILYANQAGRLFLAQWASDVGEAAPDSLVRLIHEVLAQGRTGDIEVEADGRVFSVAVTPIKDADYVYLYGHDITRLKETERELIAMKDQAQHMALHDGLTGLPNRLLLEDRLNQAIAHAVRHRRKVAVVFVDLDNFKQVNDLHGHRFGDRILAAAAHCLQTAVRRTDTVARCGGDEMVLLLPELEGSQQALAACERIKHAAQGQLAGQAGVAVTLSMGVALYPDDATQPETLLQMADAALYAAKLRGRDEVVLFAESGAMKSFEDRTRIRALLGRAVAERSIEVHYQPILDAATERWAGVEALARWHDATLGPVEPGTFIPLAEEMGLISELGGQVLETALRQLAEWDQGGLPLTLSLNVSLRQLFKPDFLTHLQTLIGRFQIDPARLIVELTESQPLLGLESEARRLEELAACGLQLSIDDFGRGHSSLSSLHRMPVHELKIDMQFVRNLRSEKGRSMARAIVNMARALGLRTVAEGVETVEEASVLRRMGVDRLQGYYFARPMPAAELGTLLRSRPPVIA